MTRGLFRILSTVVVICCAVQYVQAQCITAYPYTTNFNNATSQWFSGGIGSDWKRGKAIKTYISSTDRVWISGDTSGSSYAISQKSWVQSPCFDFTNVANPYIQFLVFWDTHPTQDGATLQYSTNNGTTWTNVGSHNDPIDCLNENWFNTPDIVNLNTLTSVKEGWSGTSRTSNGTCLVGNGIGGWVTAKHVMPYLAGAPNVVFRFCFGSGPGCNNYDGFAFDNVYIGEAPTSVASYVKGCSSTPLGYNFINTSTNCPITYDWNFGDPASGALNTSQLLNPSHVFTAPGSYQVTLTVTSFGSAQSTITNTVTTINTFGTVTEPTCAAKADGKLTITTTNGYAPITHTVSGGSSINTPPYVFNNLAADTYTVTTVDGQGCIISKAFVVTEPKPVSVQSVAMVNPDCATNSGGSITINADGGTPPYQYSLAAGYTTNAVVNNLSAGIYTVSVKDNNSCTTNSIVNLSQVGAPTIDDVSITSVSCHNGDNGKIKLIASSATAVAGFTIYPAAQQSAFGEFSGLEPSTYSITVSDINGCTNSTIVEIANPEKLGLVSNKYKYLVCKPTKDTVQYQIVGGTEPIYYVLQPDNIQSNTGMFNDVPMGNYIIQAIDAENCKAEAPLVIAEGDCCSNFFIPNAFTPNGDGQNDLFRLKIFGTTLITKFQVRNALGQTVFDNETTQGWDGYQNGIEAPEGTYFYIISYTCRDGKAYTRMGDVILMR
jgi:gliding motility-associated-like protein